MSVPSYSGYEKTVSGYQTQPYYMPSKPANGGYQKHQEKVRKEEIQSVSSKGPSRVQKPAEKKVSQVERAAIATFSSQTTRRDNKKIAAIKPSSASSSRSSGKQAEKPSSFAFQPAPSSFWQASSSSQSVFSPLDFDLPSKEQQTVNRNDYLKQLDAQDRQREKTHKPLPQLTPKDTSFKGQPIKYLSYGSFHIVFQSLREQNVLLKFIKANLNQENSDRLLELGEGDYRRYILNNGMKDYNRLKSMKIRVPHIYNNPLEDGYYKIEEIPHMPAVETWKSLPLYQLGAREKSQLDQVRAVFAKMSQAKQLLVYDFRPTNVRFDNNNKLVVIDFCEDPDHQVFRGDLVATLKDYIDEWAGGNRQVRDYLLEALK